MKGKFLPLRVAYNEQVGKYFHISIISHGVVTFPVWVQARETELHFSWTCILDLKILFGPIAAPPCPCLLLNVTAKDKFAANKDHVLKLKSASMTTLKAPSKLYKLTTLYFVCIIIILRRKSGLTRQFRFFKFYEYVHCSQGSLFLEFFDIQYESSPWVPNHTSRKHAYIILTPLNPYLYTKTGVHKGIRYFSYFCSKNIDCGYSLEPPRWGGSNEYPQSMFWVEIWKKKSVFI